MPFLVPIAVAAVAATAATAISGGFSSKRPEVPEIPFGQTPEGMRLKKESILTANMKRQQAKFGQEDTILTAGLAQASQSNFKGTTLLGGQ